MAKGDQFKSDVYAADRQDQAAASGKQGAQALGQGLMSGAEAYRSGIAQQFQQQQAMQKMALENAQVGAHVAAMEAQRQEAMARLQHTQQSILTGTQVQQLRVAKTAADMADLQLKKSQADMEERGEVPWSDRLAAHITENPIFEDPNSPTGYGYYQQTGGTGSPLGWKPKHAPKDMVDRVQERQKRRDTASMDREVAKESALMDRQQSRQDAAAREAAYKTEAKVLEKMADAITPDPVAMEKQRERVADAYDEWKGGGRGDGGPRAPRSGEPAPRQTRELPPDIEKPMGVLKDGRGGQVTVDYDGLFGDQGWEKPAGFDSLNDAPPELKQRAAKAKEVVRILRARAEESKEQLDMRRLKILVNIILRGGDPAEFLR